MELQMNQVLFNGTAIVPNKVVCVGRNYAEHIKELNNVVAEQMVVFLKPNSSITKDLLSSTTANSELHYETEICFIAQQGKLVGLGLGLDLTDRQLQSTLKQAGLPWERAKAFDGAATFSEFISLESALPGKSLADLAELTVELKVDGECRQRGSVAQMLYSPEVIYKDLQRFLTLQDGDIVMTGTPKGVGIINSGERFEATLSYGDNVLLSHTWVAN